MTVKSLELPCALHHEFEVVVSVDGTAHALIVVAELVESDDSVLFLSVPLGHEFLVDFLGCFSSILDIWVLASIVKGGNIVKFDLTVTVDVQFIVGSPDPVLSCVI